MQPTSSAAAMTTLAETSHKKLCQHALANARKTHTSMQFRESIVHTIEQSDDTAALHNQDLAHTIIDMQDVDEYMAERAARGLVWRRTLQKYPWLHVDFVTGVEEFQPSPPLSVVDVDYGAELERILECIRSDGERMNRARWHSRLSERVARAAREGGSLIEV